MKNTTEDLGCETVAAVKTPLGAGDFSQYITPVLYSGAAVLILNHYGNDMVNSPTIAVQFGLRDKQPKGKNFEVVVPLFSRMRVRGAVATLTGITASTNRQRSLKDESSTNIG